MLWKVYNVDTGQILKAGFQDEEEAKTWLENRHALDSDKYMPEEMDHDEEEEWLERQNEEEEAEEEADEEEAVVADADTVEDLVGEDDDYLDPDDGILGEVYGDEDEEDDDSVY